MTPSSIETSKKQTAFSYECWFSQLSQLKKQYTTADPFPSIVLENFLEPEAAEQALREFPRVDSESWTFYIHLTSTLMKRNLGKMISLHLVRGLKTSSKS